MPFHLLRFALNSRHPEPRMFREPAKLKPSYDVVIIGAGGAGRFSSLTLDKMLTGKVVAVTPYIDEINQGMAGGSTSQDLETMFQLLYLRFTQPRADRTAFAVR